MVNGEYSRNRSFIIHNLSFYKSFFTKLLTENQQGTAIHNIKVETAITVPVIVPKKSLNIAPVYPINAETSIFNKIKIRLRSIGLSAVKTSIGFSIG